MGSENISSIVLIDSLLIPYLIVLQLPCTTYTHVLANISEQFRIEIQISEWNDWKIRNSNQ